MAAIAKFVSYDGGVAFSDRVLKLQKRDDECGRLVPIERITGIEVDEPLLGDDGCIRVRIAGERTTAKNTIRFDEEQYDDALSFKAAFDSFIGQTAPALPPLEMFQPTSIAQRPPRKQPRYAGPEQPRRPARQTRRKRRFKWWYAAIAVVFVAILATPSKKADEEEPRQESAVSSTIEPIITTDPPAETEQASMDALCSLLELAISENFEHYNISYEDNAITVSPWQEGIAAEVTAIQLAGGNETNSDWMYLKDSISSMANSMCRLIDTAGRTDVLLYTSVQNDQNTENTLLMLLDTTIIYDCLAGNRASADSGYVAGNAFENNFTYATSAAAVATPFVGYTSPPAATAPPATQAPVRTETLVWIPTKGGTKYHSSSGCSNMDGPQQVTISEAQARGFTACKRCY